jgi:rare lipoprotein A
VKSFEVAAVPQHQTAKFARYALHLILLGSLGLAGCGYTPTIVERKDSAGKKVDTRTIADPVPKVEPITKAGNKSPYQVFGKTYFVLPSSENYRETGIASWYGRKFHGRRTSNGEIYDMYAMTAAHKSLPIPTYARVTSMENNRSIIVRINDRGPFHGPRIIDLSYVAALKLGFADKGTTEVLVEAIDPSGKSTAKPVVTPATAPGSEGNTMPSLTQGRYLQVGAFDNPDAARALQKQVRTHTSKPILVQQRDNLFKVWIGPVADKMELLVIKRMLQQSANISGFLVKQ